MDDAWMDVKEVSVRYCMKPSWVYRKAEEGVLPSYKLGKYLRFRRSEVDAWIEAQRYTPLTE